jgi:hypothetical protein
VAPSVLMMSTALMTASISRGPTSLTNVSRCRNWTRVLRSESDHAQRPSLVLHWRPDLLSFPALVRIFGIAGAAGGDGADLHWTADPEAFDAAINAIAGTLKLFRPLQSRSFAMRPRCGQPIYGL